MTARTATELPEVSLSHFFTNCIRDLGRRGGTGAKAKVKALAAATEIQTTGIITVVPRTNHGESRLPDIEKFDLGDGYRLVTQLTHVGRACRVFLYAADHEDTERWLNNHRDYTWVRNKRDGKLEFTQVSTPVALPQIPIALIETQAVSALDLPLLRDVTEAEWDSLQLSANATEILQTLTGADWEQDANGILHRVEEVAGLEVACLAADMLTHAGRGEWDALHQRIAKQCDAAETVQADALLEAVTADINAEQFVTWKDVEGLPLDRDWQDWMLFLHKEQRDFAQKEFNGPTRLRGVSGSGKTCVMVHRARHLARKYKQPVRLVTLTESTKRLLSTLVQGLCGPESAFITTGTMFSFVMDILDSLEPAFVRSFSLVRGNQFDSLAAAVNATRNHPLFTKTSLAKIPDDQLEAFLEDEIFFVRTHLVPSRYEDYLSLSRKGRKDQLHEDARKVVLAGVAAWDKTLTDRNCLDHEGVAQQTLEALNRQLLVGVAVTPERLRTRFRCVLVDEVQDLSEIELRILSRVTDPTGKRIVDQVDGLFLVGDGAQSIYNKSFSLKQCGVKVANRSYVLKKNYRNSREILEAAYGLIREYQFADADDDDIAHPTAPDFSPRHGEKPFLVKCRSRREECLFVINTIRQLREQRAATDEAAGFSSRAQLPMCVIGFSQADRKEMHAALEAAGLSPVELREDIQWDKDDVKISTVESAKGHEFFAVFIFGMTRGAMPHWRVSEDGLKREASRLYVAMTRARDNLYLSYHNAGRSPSVFLNAVEPQCQLCEWQGNELKPA